MRRLSFYILPKSSWMILKKVAEKIWKNIKFELTNIRGLSKDLCKDLSLLQLSEVSIGCAEKEKLENEDALV